MVNETIIHPQPHGEGRTHGRRAEEGIVWRIGQNGLHFFFCRGESGLFGLAAFFLCAALFSREFAFVGRLQLLFERLRPVSAQHIAHRLHSIADGGDDAR